jgi:transketolase
MALKSKIKQLEEIVQREHESAPMPRHFNKQKEDESFSNRQQSTQVSSVVSKTAPNAVTTHADLEPEEELLEEMGMVSVGPIEEVALREL